MRTVVPSSSLPSTSLSDSRWRTPASRRQEEYEEEEVEEEEEDEEEEEEEVDEEEEVEEVEEDDDDADVNALLSRAAQARREFASGSSNSSLNSSDRYPPSGYRPSRSLSHAPRRT